MFQLLRKLLWPRAADAPVRQQYPRLYDTRLESRRVLNADVGDAAGLLDLVVSASDANDGLADRFEVRQHQHEGHQEISILVNGEQRWQGDAALLSSIRLQGSSDVDEFFVDASIQFSGQIIIDGGSYVAGLLDSFVVDSSESAPFQLSTLRDHDGAIELSYWRSVDASDEPVRHSAFRVHNVVQLVDLSQAEARRFELAGGDATWQLSTLASDSRADDAHSMVQLASNGRTSDLRFEFLIPEQSLHLHSDSHASLQQSLILQDLDLSGLDLFRIDGDAADSVFQRGWLQSSRHLQLDAGLVEIDGTVHALGEVSLTVYAADLQHAGYIDLGEASSVQLNSGTSGHTTVTGSIVVRGVNSQGGFVSLLGAHVVLAETAFVDVSGDLGGGVVLIGGDRAGNNPLIQNAHFTSLMAGSRVVADGLLQGDGGRIIVFASNSTIVENAGGLSARGGDHAGSGGFIETSGKRHLSIRGTPNLSAAHGTGGQWLIDPDAIAVVASLPAVPDPNVSYILVSDLLTQLNAGGTVTLETTTASPSGDIVIESAVVANPGVTARLVLKAARDVIFNASVTGNANLGIEIDATRNVNSTGTTLSSMNYLKVESDGQVLLGTVSVGSGSLNAGQGISVSAASTIRITGNLTTVGGHIVLSGTGLVLAGAGGRTLTSGGSGLTANAAGDIDLSGVASINGLATAADLTISARGILTGGNVRLASISNAGIGVRTLSVDTRGNTTAGELILNDGVAGTTTLNVSGSLQLENALIQLADNVDLISRGDANAINLGSVATDGSSRNLQLTSDGNITFSDIDLDGGQFTATLDANNNGSAVLNSNGTVNAGTISLNGSAAGNDSLTIQDDLTSTSGAISINQFNLAQLLANATSSSGITATSVSSIELNGDITAEGLIALNTNILLTGNSGTQVVLDSSGTNSGINLGAVTASNTNVDLTLRSDRGVALQSITLAGAQVDVVFSRDNVANDSVANFAAVSADGLSVTGAGRTNDEVVLASTITLATSGLSVTQVAVVGAESTMSTTTGTLAIAAASSITLGGDLTTNGGNITLASDAFVLDGAIGITSGGASLTATTAGDIDLSGVSSIDGVTAAEDLTISARGIQNGGTVRLASISATGNGVRNLSVDTRGSTADGQLILNDGIAGTTKLDITGNLSLQNTVLRLADNVLLAVRGDNNLLSLGAVVTDGNSRSLELASDGNITTQSIDLIDGDLLVSIDVNDNDDATYTSQGALSAGSITINGSDTGSHTLTAEDTLTTTVDGILLSRFNLVQLQGDITSNTGVATSNVASLELDSDVDITAQGLIDLDAALHLTGSSGSQNVLDSTGVNGGIVLGAVTAAASNVDLSLKSDRSVSLQSVLLTGAQVEILFSRDNANNDSSVLISGAVTADGLTITGADRTNDEVTLGAVVTLGGAGLVADQIAILSLDANVTSTTGNLSVDSASMITLAGNLTTVGGNILLSSDALVLGGAGTRTLTSGGAGLTANSAGDIDLSGVGSIDGLAAAANLTISARGIQNGGDVSLASITSVGNGVQNLSVDTLGTTTSGQLTLNDGVAGDTTIDISGALSLANTTTRLADNVVMIVHGDSNALTLGNVITSGASRNLQLTSDSSISTGSVDLNGGSLVASVDANNNGSASFTSSGDIAAGFISISGSAAGNDTLSAQGELTSSVGAIALSNFSQAVLQGDVASQTSLTTTNVSQVNLGSGVDVAAQGAIQLSTNILLSGSSGSSNVIDSSGTNSAVTLGTITATNNNVDLDIRSDRSVSLQSINLPGAQVSLLFSRNNVANNSTASIAGAVTADGLSITGASRTNDTVTLGSSISLAAGGLTISQVAIASLADDVTTTTGAMNIAAATSLLLAGDLTTAGGNILLSSDALVLGGAGTRTLTSGGAGLTANSAGDIDLSDVGSIDGLAAAVDLVIDARGVQNGGDVSLASITSAGNGVQNLSVDTRGTTTSGQLTLNDGVTGDTTIDISGALSLANTTTRLADNVVMIVHGDSNALTLGNVISSGASRNLQLTSDSSISTGSVDLNGGSLVASVDANNNGSASFTSSGDIAAGFISISGSAAGNDTLSAQGELTSSVGAIALSNFSQAVLQGDVASQTSLTATNVSQVNLGSGVDITAQGAIQLNTNILLSGSSGSTNVIDSSGTNSAVTLGAITATNNNVDLDIRSDRSVSLQSINLPGSQVDILFSRNNVANNSTASIAGAVTADGMSITGASRTNDTVTLGSSISLAAVGLTISQVAIASFADDVTSTTGAIGVAAATSLSLAGDLTTVGGNILLSSDALVLGGAGTHTLTSGGAGLTATTAGDIDLSGVGTIDGLAAAANLTISARGIQNGGDVSLASITSAGNGVQNLSVDTRGTTTSGQLTLNDSVAGDTTIDISGALSLANTTTRLADNVVMIVHGDNNPLTLGNVISSGASRNLQLTSDSSISTGSVDLNGGSLVASVDANNNGSASFTSSGDVVAGSISISGSAAGNDTLSAQGELTSSVGDITLSNFSQAVLQGDVASQTSLTTTNVSQVNLGSGVDVTAQGAVQLNTNILLSGNSGSSNVIDSSGTNSAVTLGAVTATNNNVDLDIRSDRSVSLQGINLPGAQVSVLFSRNNVANNSTASIAGAVTADGLSITGASRTNDTVTLGSSISLAAGGLTISQVAIVSLADDVTTTTGAISIAASTSLSLAGDLTTVGGNIFLSSDALVLGGAGTRTLTSGGAGLTANSAGDIDLSGVGTIDGLAAAADLVIDARGVQNGGDVSLASITSAGNGVQNLSVDTRGTTTSGQLTLNDGVAGDTTIDISGALSLANTTTRLADNVVMIVHGDSNALTLGNVITSGASRNLQLTSDSSIATGSVDLNGGSLVASVDENNNGSASFTSSGDIAAGSISISGSAAGNDTFSAQGELTSSVGAITLSNFSQAVLQGDVASQASLTATNVSQVNLASGVDVTAQGAIQLNTNILLSGSSGSTNVIDASGTNSAVTLGAITATNNNVDLDIRSDRSVSLQSINSLGAQVNILFSRNNVANNSTASIAGAVTVDGLSITGASRTNDTVTLGSSISLAAGGFSITQVASASFADDVTTTTGAISIAAATGITLAGNLSTVGADINLSGGRLLIDGATLRELTTGNGATQGGGVNLSGLTAIDGSASIANLAIDSRGAQNGGDVSLAVVTNTGTGINSIAIASDGVVDGQVTIASIRLVHGVAPSLLSINANDLTPTAIRANGVIDLSSSVIGQRGGSINFGGAIVVPTTAGATLSLLTGNTNTTAGDDASDGGDITFAGVGANGSVYFSTLVLDLGASDAVDASGTLQLIGTNPSLLTGGSSGGNAQLAGITIAGQVDVAAGQTLTLSTNAGAVSGLNSRAIDLTRATVNGSHRVVLDTSGGNRSAIAGHILIGDLGGVTPLAELQVDSRGTTTSGRLIINNGISAATVINVAGDLNLSNTIVQLADNVSMTTLGDGNLLALGTVITDGSSRSLQLASDGDITTASVSLLAGNLIAQIDSNDNSISSFINTGSISAGSISVSGSAAGNDIFNAQSSLTSSVGAIDLSGFSHARLGGDATSQSDFVATNIGTLELSGGVDLVAIGSMDLANSVNSILLSGASGSSNTLDASGNSSSINLAAITATNSNVDLTLNSDRSVHMSTAQLPGGQLNIHFSRNNPANTSTATFDGSLIADGVTVQGAGRVNDTVTYSGALTLGNAGLHTFEVATVRVLANVNASGAIRMTQINNRIQLDTNIGLSAGGNVDLQSAVNLVELLGPAGSTNQILTTGDSSLLQLANVQGLAGTDLRLVSNHNVTVGSINLNAAGNLEIVVDQNNNSASTQLIAGQLTAGTITLAGGLAQNDTASLAGEVRSLGGGVYLHDFASISLTSSIISATEVRVFNVSQHVRLGNGVNITASNDIDLRLGSGQIELTDPSSSTNLVDAVGNVWLSRLTGLSGGQLSVVAGSNIELSEVNLVGSLQATAGAHGAVVGTINASGLLTASSLSFESATGIGSSLALETAASSMSATNRVQGDIRISNQNSSLTTISTLATVEGVSIVFHQQGGGDARFLNVASMAAGLPNPSANNIELVVQGANLHIDGSGLVTNGQGRVLLATTIAGSIQLQSALQANLSGVELQSSQNITGSGLVSAASLSMQAVGHIGGTTQLQTQTGTLSSITQLGATNILNTSAVALSVSSLRSTTGGSIALQQVGGGELLVGHVSSGAQQSAGNPDITLINSASSMKVLGSVSAGGNGSIHLVTAGNLVLEATSQLTTFAESALIEVEALGQIQFQPGAVVRAGSSSAATETVITQLPPVVQLRPVINSLGVSVDAEGLGVIDIFLLPSGTGVLDQNYALTIAWGDGTVDVLPFGALDPNTFPPTAVRFDASPFAYRFSHQYDGNPSSTDPSAPIPVDVTVRVDALNRVRFSDGNQIQQSLTRSSDAVLEVPSTGLVSLYFVLPQTPVIPIQLTIIEEPEPTAFAPVIPTESVEIETSSPSETSIQQPRRYVLRLMTPVDENGGVESSRDPKDDIPLDPEDIANLDGLFARLSDNRYRIFVILEDGNELLLKDILLRNHRPVEIDDSFDLQPIERNELQPLDAPSEISMPQAFEAEDERLKRTDPSAAGHAGLTRVTSMARELKPHALMTTEEQQAAE